MKCGSLFSGIGGLDMAVCRFFGAELAWVCEIEPGPVKVLQRHFPDVPNLGDVTKVDWSEVEPVDIICGGYPCQPFSVAGLKRGEADERHLWPYFKDALRVLRPEYAILENVSGHLRLGFDRVLADLAEVGFDARWSLVRASDVGAPHRRERLFVLATNTASKQDNTSEPTRLLAQSPCPSGSTPSNPEGGGLDPARSAGSGHEAHHNGSGEVPVPDATVIGFQRDGRTWKRRAGLTDIGESAANPERHRPQIDALVQEQRRGEPSRGSGEGMEWGAYEPAIRRWERVMGPAPTPVDDRQRLAPEFVEWMMGFPAGHVDGLTRTQALKALGNAVVPQQAFAALMKLTMESVLSKVEAS